MKNQHLKRVMAEEQTIKELAEGIQFLLTRVKFCEDLDKATKDLSDARDYLAKIHGKVIAAELKLRAEKRTLPEDTIKYLDKLVSEALDET